MNNELDIEISMLNAAIQTVGKLQHLSECVKEHGVTKQMVAVTHGIFECMDIEAGDDPALALEGIGEMVIKAYNAIVKFIQDLWNKMVKFLARADKTLRGKIKSVTAIAQSTLDNIDTVSFATNSFDMNEIAYETFTESNSKILEKYPVNLNAYVISSFEVFKQKLTPEREALRANVTESIEMLSRIKVYNNVLLNDLITEEKLTILIAGLRDRLGESKTVTNKAKKFTSALKKIDSLKGDQEKAVDVLTEYSEYIKNMAEFAKTITLNYEYAIAEIESVFKALK